jgi:hypothetical protein
VTEVVAEGPAPRQKEAIFVDYAQRRQQEGDMAMPEPDEKSGMDTGSGGMGQGDTGQGDMGQGDMGQGDMGHMNQPGGAMDEPGMSEPGMQGGMGGSEQGEGDDKDMPSGG